MIGAVAEVTTRARLRGSMASASRHRTARLLCALDARRIGTSPTGSRGARDAPPGWLSPFDASSRTSWISRCCPIRSGPPCTRGVVRLGSEGELGPDVARPAGTTTCEIFESFKQKPRRLTLRPAPPPCSSGTANICSMRTVPPSIRTWISRPWSSPTCSASRPAQPRPGEQVVEGRLQACRCVPSQVRLRRVPDMASWERSTLIIDLLDNDEALSLPYERVVGLLGGTAEYRMQLRCFPGECKAAEVDAREQPSLEYTDVLYRSRKWTIARSSVLARERVPLGLEHVPLCSR